MENNRKSLQLYRNETPYENIDEAKEALESKLIDICDGEILAVRYKENQNIKTLIGTVAENNGTKSITYFEEIAKKEIINNEKVVERAFEKLQDVIGLDDNFNFAFDGDLSDCKTIVDAIIKLQDMIQILK